MTDWDTFTTEEMERVAASARASLEAHEAAKAAAFAAFEAAVTEVHVAVFRLLVAAESRAADRRTPRPSAANAHFASVIGSVDGWVSGLALGLGLKAYGGMSEPDLVDLWHLLRARAEDMGYIEATRILREAGAPIPREAR